MFFDLCFMVPDNGVYSLKYVLEHNHCNTLLAYDVLFRYIFYALYAAFACRDMYSKHSIAVYTCCV